MVSGMPGIVGEVEAKLAAERRERARLRDALEAIGKLARAGQEGALIRIQGIVTEALGLTVRR